MEYWSRRHVILEKGALADAGLTTTAAHDTCRVSGSAAGGKFGVVKDGIKDEIKDEMDTGGTGSEREAQGERGAQDDRKEKRSENGGRSCTGLSGARRYLADGVWRIAGNTVSRVVLAGVD